LSQKIAHLQVSNFQKCPPFLDFSTKKQKVYKNIYIPTLPFSEQP
jgi:hypothetical protein